MKNTLRLSLAIAISLSIAACNDGDNWKPTPPPPPPTPATFDMSGTIIKGALIGAKVQIYRASDTALSSPLTTEPADVQTDENGDYEATVVDASGTDISGALVVNITADADTQMRCDAAVMCGTTLRGDLIPNAEVAGLSLSTITLATGDGAAVNADANTLTTMATDAVLEQVAANPNIPIDTLPAAGLAALQQNASSIVGQILGVDLSTTNIYEIKIVDASNTGAVTDAATDAGEAASITNTLTFLNASLASLDVAEGSTIGDTINHYVDNVAVVSAVVVEAVANDEEIGAALATVDTGIRAELASTQQEVSDQVTLVKVAVEDDSGVTFESTPVPTAVSDESISVVIIVDIPVEATGGTGGTGG